MKSKKHILKPFIAIIIILFISFTIYLDFAKDSKGDTYLGELEWYTYDVSSTVSGILIKTPYNNGDTVGIGSIVAIIDNQDALFKYSKAKAAYETLLLTNNKTTLPARDEELIIQEENIKQLENQKIVLENNKKKLEISQKQNSLNLESLLEIYNKKDSEYSNIKELFENGTESKSNYDLAYINMISAKNNYLSSIESNTSINLEIDSMKNQILALEHQLEASKTKLNMLNNGATTVDEEIMLTNLNVLENDMNLAESFLEKHNVKSYQNGKVESYNFTVGDFVNVGSPLVTITDSDHLKMKIFVAESDLSSVSLGKDLIIRSTNDKIDNTFKGKITKISQEAMYTPINIVTIKDREKLVYEVEIELEYNNSIKAGMLMSVDLLENK
jgi:HlyD family secretion protein